MSDTIKQPLDHLRSKKKPVRRTVYLVGDETLWQEREDETRKLDILKRRLDRSRTLNQEVSQKDQDDETALMERVEALRERVQEEGVAFVLQSLGREGYSTLIDEHPPTEAQIKEVLDEAEALGQGKKVRLSFNPSTYPYALVARSIVNVDAPVEEIEEWLKGPDFNSAEIEYLFSEAIGCNINRRVFEMGKG